MATFVLVHGAMHGGWCWRDVRRHLAMQGHDVYTPTLTGQGDRRRLLARDVGVATHVSDITDVLWFEDLHDVHLVLHSYAGVHAGPIADVCHDRLRSITYLAAFVTRPGECLLDIEPPETAVRYRQLAADSGDGWRLPATGAFLEQWGVTDSAPAAWVEPRLTDFPLRCQTDPTEFDPETLAALPTSYVRHTSPPLASLDQSFQRAVDAGFPTYEVPCGHDTMIAAPELTARVLLTIAES